MAAGFVLLELQDPEVASFLWTVRSILSGRNVTGPIHVTLRGPYSEAPPRDELEGYAQALRYDVLRIAGVGRFSNPSDRKQPEVVFFKVDSPNLRSVWWKKSFPIKKHGFAPHISVYRGNDSDLADLAHATLDAERIDLACAEHSILWYQAGQRDLFARNVPTLGEVVNLEHSTRVDIGTLERLREVVDSYHAKKRDSSELSVRP